MACGAGTLAQGSSLSGLTAGSHGGEPDTLAARLDAGRVTGASIGPGGTWPAALGRLDAPVAPDVPVVPDVPVAPDVPDLGLRPVKLLEPEKPPWPTSKTLGPLTSPDAPAPGPAWARALASGTPTSGAPSSPGLAKLSGGAAVPAGGREAGVRGEAAVLAGFRLAALACPAVRPRGGR